MITATATDVSLLEPFQTEWSILRERRLNVLLEGPVTATNAVLLLLRPHLGDPIVWNSSRAPFELPSEDSSALILRDVAALSADDQMRLLAWLGGAGSRTQIVSMTERPLFAGVARGLFDETLYYRLNIMRLRVGSTNPSGLQDYGTARSPRRVDNPTAARTPKLG